MPACARRHQAVETQKMRGLGDLLRALVTPFPVAGGIDAKRLKGGKLAEAKLRNQLLDIAKKMTGGQKTDELTDKKAGPFGLPDSIIVTAEGVEGAVPVAVPADSPIVEAAPVAEPEAAAPAKKSKPAPKAKANAKAKPKPKAKAKPTKKKGK